MKRRQSERPKGQLARLVALGLLAGILAGAGAARDIERSFDKGRIAPVAAASAMAALPAAPSPASSPGDLDLAETHGYAMAAELGFTSRDDCRTIEPALRRGCLDYVDSRSSEAPGALDPPL